MIGTPLSAVTARISVADEALRRASAAQASVTKLLVLGLMRRMRKGRSSAPEAGMDCKRLGLDLGIWSADLDRALAGGQDCTAGQVHGRVLHMVAGELQQPPLADAINEAADAGPIEAAGAHAAGLERTIEHAAEEIVSRKAARRLAGEIGLGVPRPPVGRIAVLGLQHEGAGGIDQDGAE